MPNELNVKVFKCRPNAVIPKYATKGSAGFDLATTEDLVIAPGATFLAPTGLKLEVPEGFELQVRPRSGLSLKTKLRVANSPATVDSDYRGELQVILENTAVPSQDIKHYEAQVLRFKAGDRIAQGVIVPVYQATFAEVASADDLSQTDRGDGGFGHSGVKS